MMLFCFTGSILQNKTVSFTQFSKILFCHNISIITHMKQYILRIENMIPYFQKQIKLQHNHIRKHLDSFIENKRLAKLWLSNSLRHEHIIIAFYNHKVIKTKIEIFGRMSFLWKRLTANQDRFK